MFDTSVLANVTLFSTIPYSMSERQGTPGEAIQTELKLRGWTQDDLARILGRPRPAIVNVIQGKRGVTPDLAVGLAAAFGGTAEEWLAMEATRQIKLLAPNGSSVVAQRRRLFEMAPIKDMQRRGWISETSDPAKLECELCEFFGIDAIDKEPSLSVATRRPGAAPLTIQQRAWLFRAKRLAEAMPTAQFNSRVGNGLVKQLRALAAYPIEARRVPRILSENGIRFVVVEGLPGGSIDGATFWLNEYSPVVAISMRYDRVDWFWFTLCHECAHVLNGDAISVDNNLVGPDRDATVDDDIERRANAEAAAMLISPEEIDSFVRRVGPMYSKPRIIQFANRVRIHPGIVVGQLHHRNEVKPFAHREMLVKIRDYVVNSAITDGWGHSPGML